MSKKTKDYLLGDWSVRIWAIHLGSAALIMGLMALYVWLLMPMPD